MDELRLCKHLIRIPCRTIITEVGFVVVAAELRRQKGVGSMRKHCRRAFRSIAEAGVEKIHVIFIALPSVFQPRLQCVDQSGEHKWVRLEQDQQACEGFLAVFKGPVGPVGLRHRYGRVWEEEQLIHVLQQRDVAVEMQNTLVPSQAESQELGD